MRVFIFHCLLLVVWAQTEIPWQNLPGSLESYTCHSGSCGCCLMQKQIGRMKHHFENLVEEMNTYLNETKTALDFTRVRSAFSVSLTSAVYSCSVPALVTAPVIYDNVMLNMGGGYDASTGIFAAPVSGVYSITVTIHAKAPSGDNVNSCVSLRVNSREVSASLSETDGNDPQDSSSIVVTMKLREGDQVSVVLHAGCVICNKDQGKHFNTYTGFLLYPTLSVSG